MDSSDGGGTADGGLGRRLPTVEMRDAPSSSFPFVRTALSMVEQYGWFIIIGLLLSYFAWHKIHQYRTHKQAFDPSRVSRLNSSLRAVRSVQCEEFAARAATAAAEDKEKAKQKDEMKERERLHLNSKPLDDDDDDDNDNDDDPIRAATKKANKSAWIDKMSGASSSKSGFKPYNRGTGPSSNIRGPRRFTSAPRNCGPTS